MAIPQGIISESSARTGNQLMSSQDLLNQRTTISPQERERQRQDQRAMRQQERQSLIANAAPGTRRIVSGGFPIYLDGKGNQIQNPGGSKTMATSQPTTLPMPPSGGMNPAPGQYSQWGNNPMPVGAPNQPGQIPMPPAPGSGAGSPGAGGGWGTFQNMPPQTNTYGGQQIAGSTPSMGEYDAVRGYADQAHEQARRYLDPQQAMQKRRFDQELINKGIDPNSAQGQEAAAQLARQQADADNAASFGALQFGQGIQNQMSQQELANQQIASSMEQARWGSGLGMRGQDVQRELGLGGLENQRYSTELGHQLGLGQLDLGRYQTDLGHQLGMGQLDYTRGMGEHGQMMDLLGYDMNVRQYNDSQQMMQDALYNQMYAGVPVPGFSATNPYSPYGQQAAAGDTKWWSGGGGFNFGL